MLDIVTVGEALIDLTQTFEDATNIRHYAAYPGGAPANVAVAAAKLGASTAFIGKVGCDTFGKSIKRMLYDNHVDVTGLYEVPLIPTTLAVVSADPGGERDFSFYRTPGADTLLTCTEAVQALHTLKEAPVFLHFGSVSLAAEISRSAVLGVARYARTSGILLSYNPNYRASLWPDRETAVEQIKVPLELCDVLKLAEEELELLTGTNSTVEGSRQLYLEYRIPLIVVTQGSKGTFYRFGDRTGHIAAWPVKAIDTSGAGDTFLGALLHLLARHIDGSVHKLSQEQLEQDLCFANRAAALTCTRAGAIPAMPTLDELVSKQGRHAGWSGNQTAWLPPQ